MKTPTVTVNGQPISLIPQGRGKHSLKDVSKAEIFFENGDKLFISLYSTGNSVPTPVAPADESYDSSQRKVRKPVVAKSATSDGGNAKMRSDVIALAAALGLKLA